ncbi:G-protein coupled receptor Mth2-like [Linepithema humile]|uniref:G-protein coupled receptor Mth2-like n=1 Tax=Linepithema humile TaxID=83485 RepID=UPI00351F7375
MVSIYLDIKTAVVIASLLCLLMTFIVYSICPELQNMHGYTLRSYVASLFVVFTIMLIVHKKETFEEIYPVCVAASLLFYFCFFASLFWQNAICFDILRTFGGVRFLHKSVKQSKRKIFLAYSFCVWGIASIYVVICAIMNFVPTVPDNIQPNICITTFGFAQHADFAYFEIPISVLIICNICFLIFTMLNIVRATKIIDSFLKDAENKHQTKQRSMMYLKLLLFADINLGLLRIFRWTSDMIIAMFDVVEFVPNFILLIIDIIEFLQGFVIFIIFVCKKRIWQLLLKRFGCEKLFVKRKSVSK